MNPFFNFLNRLDKTAWRAVGVTGLLLVGVLAVLLFGKLVLFNGEHDVFQEVQDVLEGLRTSPLGLLAVIILFCVTAFLGAPQFGLIGAVVLAFGPVLGFCYSWIATLVSASMTFWLGRVSGMTLVRRYGGDSIQRMSKFMGKNAFLASAVVRNVPTAPFIVVNMAFGVTEAKFLHFLSGAAVGIIPKTLLTALFGQVVVSSLAGNPLFAAAAVIAMTLLWIPLMLIARTRLGEMPKKDEVSLIAPTSEDSPEA
jgi:uncharacterized membrane protein YdjX (TVP38/TMEM64 family)